MPSSESSESMDPFAPIVHLFIWGFSTAFLVGLGVLLGWTVARVLRAQRLSWTWAAWTLVVVLVAHSLLGESTYLLGAAALAAAFRSHRWQREDTDMGGDLAEISRSFVSPLDIARALYARVSVERMFKDEGSWFQGNELAIGKQPDGSLVRIPLGDEAGGTHTFVVGATRSGKTNTMTWIAVRAIERGMGAIVVNPKGDDALCRNLRRAAQAAGVPFLKWTPEGDSVYNPYARGGASEVADKLLAGEQWSEPHYLRQAQRYLGLQVPAMRQADVVMSLANIVRYLIPNELEALVRHLSGDRIQKVKDYLGSLTQAQRNGLSGVRDRLAIMAESDVGPWLDPETPDAEQIDLLEAVKAHAVVYFNLEADSRPLLSQMLAAAIVQDIQWVVAELQNQPIPTLVMIDEFSAIAPERVAGLFGRAAGAGVSLLLAALELADLRLPGRERLLEQVMGNLSALIVHRQVMPGSAELIAEIAGTEEVWATALRGDGETTRTRTREFLFHPNRLKKQRRGEALAVVPTGEQPVSDTWVFSARR